MKRLLWIVFVLVMWPAVAFAQEKQEELPKRQANFAWEKNEKTGVTVLKASFSFRDVVDKSIQEKLVSGLPITIAMRAYVLKEGASDPIALAVRTCVVKYDLWDEVYSLKISGPGGRRRRGGAEARWCAPSVCGGA